MIPSTTAAAEGASSFLIVALTIASTVSPYCNKERCSRNRVNDVFTSTTTTPQHHRLHPLPPPRRSAKTVQTIRIRRVDRVPRYQ
jgi:hypothetical protein